MNINNNYINKYRKTNTFRGPTPGNNGFMNHLAQKNQQFNNGNNYPTFDDFQNVNNITYNNNNINHNKNNQIGRALTFETPQPPNKKKDLKIDLQKAFDAINEDFLYIPPILIPLIPGNDPNDGYNEEEHL